MVGIELQELDNVFTYHAPHGDQVERYAKLRIAAKFLAQQFLEQCPPSRERSLAITKIQEAVMMGNASIAIHESHIDEV